MHDSTALGSLVESPVIALLLFAVFFWLFVLAFAGRDTPRFILGLLRLIGAFFSAPVRYLRGATLAIVVYATTTADHRRDRQFLIRTVLMASNAAIFLVGIGILAGGGVLAWRAFAPPEVRVARAQAAKAIPAAAAQTTEAEKGLAEINAKLGTQTPEEKRVEELGKELATAKQQLGQMRASLDESGYEHWPPVRQHLDSNETATAEWQISQVHEAVTRYLSLQVSPPALDAILKYLAGWERTRRLQGKVSQAERNNPRAQLLRDKAAADERLAEKKRALAELKDQASFFRVLHELHPFLAAGAIISAIFSFLLFIWGVGLLVEWAGLAVDIATNIRRLAEAAPAEPGASMSAPNGP